MFKFESKSNEFKNSGIKFQKLSHLIESKILTGDIQHDFILMVIDSYDNLSSSVDDIPLWICNRVRGQYS